METWKDVIGFEGHYKVSDKGRVMSIKRDKQRILKNVTTNFGYSIVSLIKNHTQKQGSVSRMVMSAFIGLSDLQVNHKDGNKKNNCLENLEYCTAKENTNHAHRTGLVNAETIRRQIEAKERNGKMFKSVVCCNTGKVYNGLKFAAKDLNIPAKRISDVARGRKKTYKGFSFRYS